MIIEATPMTTLILQTKILKKHSAPEYTRGPRQGDIFCPWVYSGSAFKGLTRCDCFRQENIKEASPLDRPIS